ncbi:hypothetical protein [Staphylococcus pseudoxylosus]|nr:hypothetical protein [Staphylococcus pseudoxylosus]
MPNKLSICIDAENRMFTVITLNYKLVLVVYTHEVYADFAKSQ